VRAVGTGLDEVIGLGAPSYRSGPLFVMIPYLAHFDPTGPQTVAPPVVRAELETVLSRRRCARDLLHVAGRLLSTVRMPSIFLGVVAGG